MNICGFNIAYKYRPKSKPFGRFGGGWDWKFGFQSGGNTLIISLLVCDLTIWKSDKK